MNWRALLLALVALLFAAPAFAQKEGAFAAIAAGERINRFDVLIEVERDGDIIVTETLNVTAQGNAIQRGIFRDLPRFLDNHGARIAVDQRILSVQRDGRDEPYETSTEGNAFRIRIGDPEIMLSHGEHTYVIRYEVKNQIRYFDGYDEIYWNATGNYWAFPINRVRATIQLPPGAVVTQHHGYTGALGQSGTAFTYTASGDRHIFETTRPLQPEEGLTVAVGFEKGVIDPPSAADRGALWWQRNGALLILAVSLGGLFWFLYGAFEKVGRDPVKGPVFPRYEPPSGYSPAAVHHIFNRTVAGHRALIATLMNLAVKRRISIDASDKKNTVLTRNTAAGAPSDIPAEDLALEASIFAGRQSKSLGAKYDSDFTSAYTAFTTALGHKYGGGYFRWNIGYTLAAIALSLIVIFIAITQITQWTLWHTLAIAAVALMNVAFLYFMPAPTAKGQAIRSEIEGFKLYMEKAEKLQLNAVDVGLEQPPMMTKERYERFLPYAIALDVEEPWTKHFERLLPEEAANYSPTWGHGASSRSLGALTGALVANMSSGVSSALPQSSSSSGSGGGGSSGGGGGGGGGGGW